jgi:hypothetical protein
MKYHARWISKTQRNSLLRTGNVGNYVLLSSCRGFIIVEPVGSNLGDGEILSPQDAEFEMQETWCQDSKSRLEEARRRLLGGKLDTPRQTKSARPVLDLRGRASGAQPRSANAQVGNWGMAAHA